MIIHIAKAKISATIRHAITKKGMRLRSLGCQKTNCTGVVYKQISISVMFRSIPRFLRYSLLHYASVVSSTFRTP